MPIFVVSEHNISVGHELETGNIRRSCHETGRLGRSFSCALFFICAVWFVDHHVILFDRRRLGQYGLGVDSGLAYNGLCSCLSS